MTTASLIPAFPQIRTLGLARSFRPGQSQTHRPSMGMESGMSSHGSADSALALDLLDEDVRAEIRRQGVDPLTDVESVRAFARPAVRAHDQRSLTGIVRPVEDPEQAVDDLVNRVSGFGPLQPYLDDPSVEEIWVNEP